MRNKVIVFSELPPPFTGQARNSVRFIEFLGSQGIATVVIGYKVNFFGKSWLYYTTKLFSFLKALKIWLKDKNSELYLCAESGSGRVLFITASIVCCVFNRKMIAHIRTREFYNEENIFYKQTFNNKNITYIVLCHNYYDRLLLKYPRFKGIVISNLSLYEDSYYLTEFTKDYLQDYDYIFFSNLIEAKGVYDFIEIAKLMSEKRFVIVGNGSEIERNRILSKLELVSNCFLDSGTPDLKRALSFGADLIFPSRYKVEVEPNVIYEFLLAGRRVFSYEIACVESMNFKSLKKCGDSILEMIALLKSCEGQVFESSRDEIMQIARGERQKLVSFFSE